MALLSQQQAAIAQLKQRETMVFKNPSYQPDATVSLPAGFDLVQAKRFWERCLPVIETCFGCNDFSSPLLSISTYQRQVLSMGDSLGLYLKADHQLPITGSVKARGGLYELLHHAVDLAEKNGLLVKTSYEQFSGNDSCSDFEGVLSDKAKHCFAQHKIIVGSTGNLGLSIGTIGCALGFNVEVHMSHDAKAWKKDKLRSLGVTVVEHQGDYSLAVAEARTIAATDASAYFVDDESSVLLMLGYAQAAAELAIQLAQQQIRPTVDNPLVVLIPCGVGGAPVGISLGMKSLWGNTVHPIFVEPVDAPCMSLALLKDDCVPIQSIGLSGITAADGLAVGAASPLALAFGKQHIAGCATVQDQDLYLHLQSLYETENIRIEPSAAAGLAALDSVLAAEVVPSSLIPGKQNLTVIVWSTGGGLLPEEEFEAYRQVTEQ